MRQKLLESHKKTCGDDNVLILPLGSLRRGDVAVAGGKGANLGELIRAGFQVPDGFVITTAAYDCFIELNHLEETVSGVSGKHERKDIPARFEEAAVPEVIVNAAATAYREMGGGRVAVRSSATAEDLPEAAFAGQQETFLDIEGGKELVDAVKRCWASLWSERAIAYRERQKIGQATVKMAVVVQRMISAAIAGVLFTVNPVTGARDEISIDANPGLGEAVVSGTVTPDHFVLRRRFWGWTVAVRHLGRHKGKAVPGGDEQTVLSLTDKELKELARLGRSIESHFGRPQDIEWAAAGGNIYVVQARPMTAVPEPPLYPGWSVRTAAGMLSEFLPERPYPLEVTSWTPEPFKALASMIKPIGLRFPPFGEFFDVEDGIVTGYRGRVNLSLTPMAVFAPFRFWWLARRYDPLHWREDPLLAKAISIPADLVQRDLKELDWTGLLSTLRESISIISPFLGELRRRYLPGALEAIICLQVEVALLGRGKKFSVLTSGVRTITLETNQMLENMAELVRDDSRLSGIFSERETQELRGVLGKIPQGRKLLDKFDAFLDCCGHRETASLLTFYQPTWKESPDVVLGMIKELAQSKPSRKQTPEPWENARDEVLLHPLLKLPPLRRHFIKLLETARCFKAIREDTRFYAALPLPVMRQTCLEMGRRLLNAGVLGAADDVFHLTLAELVTVNRDWPPPAILTRNLRIASERRKKRREALKDIPLIDPRLFRRTGHAGEALVSGNPASRGVAEGIVRVIRQASEFNRLQQGEILVAPFTNPAWTPLFRRAAAVVADTGGAASHAAIVAREYGIPAVMGTTDGTRRLRDGQRVRVDGGLGKVFDAEGK